MENIGGKYLGAIYYLEETVYELKTNVIGIVFEESRGHELNEAWIDIAFMANETTLTLGCQFEQLTQGLVDLSSRSARLCEDSIDF